MTSPTSNSSSTSPATTPATPSPSQGPDMTSAQADLLRDLLLPLLHAGTGDLTLDLSGITDCDSSGVQLLLAARNSLQARGHRLHLYSASPAVRDALARFGLATLPGLRGTAGSLDNGNGSSSAAH